MVGSPSVCGSERSKHPEKSLRIGALLAKVAVDVHRPALLRGLRRGSEAIDVVAEGVERLGVLPVDRDR